VDDNGLDSEFFAGTNDTHSDFAAIGDENFPEGR